MLILFTGCNIVPHCSSFREVCHSITVVTVSHIEYWGIKKGGERAEMEREQLSAEFWEDWGWSLCWNSRGAVRLQVHCRGKGFSGCFLILFCSQTLFSHYLSVAQVLKTHPTGCWVFHARNALGNVASPELDCRSALPCNDCPGLGSALELPWDWDPQEIFHVAELGAGRSQSKDVQTVGAQSRWGWRALCRSLSCLLLLLPNWQLSCCRNFISCSLWNLRRILLKKWVWTWTHHLLLLPGRACSKQQTIHLKGFWLTTSCELIWGFNSSFFSLWGAETW